MTTNCFYIAMWTFPLVSYRNCVWVCVGVRVPPRSEWWVAWRWGALRRQQIRWRAWRVSFLAPRRASRSAALPTRRRGTWRWPYAGFARRTADSWPSSLRWSVQQSIHALGCQRFYAFSERHGRIRQKQVYDWMTRLMRCIFLLVTVVIVQLPK